MVMGSPPRGRRPHLECLQGDEDNIHFKITWKHIDMVPDEGYEGEHPDMVKHALKIAVKAFNNTENNAEKDIAQQIKKEFDKEYMVSILHHRGWGRG